MAKKMPFPLEVFEAEEVKRLTAAQYGLFSRLAFSYWNTGLAIPETPYAISRLANADIGTVQRHRDIVLQCLRIVMPDLEKRYTARQTSLQKMRLKTTMMNNIKKTRLETSHRENNSMLADGKESGEVVATPHYSNFRDMKNRSEKYDQSARESAVSAPKSPEKTLTDG